MSVETPGAITGTTASRAADEIVARLERLPFSRFHLRLASLLGTGTFFDAFDSLAIAVALTVVFTTLHIGFVNAGLLISSAYIGQFVGAIVFGYTSEVFGRRLSFVIALGIFGFFSVLAAISWNFESLFAIRLLQGIGLGAEVPIAGALFNEYVRGKSRGQVVMIYESAFTWGLLLTPLIGAGLFALIGPALGWRVLFGIGGIPLLVAVVAYFKLPESARWLADKGRYAEADGLVKQIEREHDPAALAPVEIRYRADIRPTQFGELFKGMYLNRTILSWVQWFTTYFVTYGYSVWLPTLYVQLGGLNPRNAVLLSVSSGLVSVVMAYVFAWAVDRIGRKPMFVFGFALSMLGAILGIVFVAVLHITGWPTLLTANLFMSVGMGFNAIGVYVYTPELYPTRMRAWATATGSSMNRVASFIAPLLVGGILAAKMGIQTVFIMFFCVSLLGFIVMVILGVETKQRVLEELSA